MYNGYNAIRPTREVQDYKYGDVTPIKSMVAVQGECMLFNVNMYHDWFNASSNRRTVLTLRPIEESVISFDDAANYLFDNLLNKSS